MDEIMLTVKHKQKELKVKGIFLYTKGKIVDRKLVKPSEQFDITNQNDTTVLDNVKAVQPKEVNRLIDDYWPNRFAKDLLHAFAFYKIPIPRQGKWRLCDYRLGHVRGFLNTYGRVFATDGIMCFIYQGENTWAMGHYEYFIPDSDPEVEERKEQRSANKRGPYKKKPINIDFLV